MHTQYKTGKGFFSCQLDEC